MIEADLESFVCDYYTSVVGTGIRGIVYAASSPNSADNLFIWNIVDIDNTDVSGFGVIGDSMTRSLLKAREEGEFNLHMGFISSPEVQSIESLCKSHGMKVGSLTGGYLPETRPHLRIVR